MFNLTSKGEFTMSTIVRKYPALSLLVLAMILGAAPVVAINAGLLPESADQLGAFSASLAGIILAAIEGRKGAVWGYPCDSRSVPVQPVRWAGC
jgi:hypothetical protein